MMKLRMLRIQKRRNMSAGDKMNLSHPRRKVLHCAEPVRHQPPIPEAVDGIAVVYRFALVFCLFRLPDGIVSVYPQNDEINVHMYSSGDFLAHNRELADQPCQKKADQIYNNR